MGRLTRRSGLVQGRCAFRSTFENSVHSWPAASVRQLGSGRERGVIAGKPDARRCGDQSGGRLTSGLSRARNVSPLSSDFADGDVRYTTAEDGAVESGRAAKVGPSKVRGTAVVERQSARRGRVRVAIIAAFRKQMGRVNQLSGALELDEDGATLRPVSGSE